MCTLGLKELWPAMLAGLLTVPLQGLVQTCCRGRSFLVRTQEGCAWIKGACVWLTVTCW